MATNHFTSNNVQEFQKVNHNSISGYEDSPLLTLEQSVEKLTPIIPDLKASVAIAKKECRRSSNLLTPDESAAIYLYTMPTCFFSRLNQTLRAENRRALKPWFGFLKLFISALKKIPPIDGTFWRAVSGDVGSIFDNEDEHIWWNFNSCSKKPSIVQYYVGSSGTLFAIQTLDARDITEFSAIPIEQEVVLMPGTRLRAKCKPLKRPDGFLILHLEDITSQK